MEKKYVSYEEFGAIGDGKTDDFDAIAKAHEYANENGYEIRANDALSQTQETTQDTHYEKEPCNHDGRPDGCGLCR